MTSKRVLPVLIVFFFCSLMASVSLVAQESAVPRWIMVSRIQVKPEMMSEFWDIQREVKEHYKETDVPFRLVWNTRVFGDAYEYAVVTPISSMSIFDEPHPLRDVLEPESWVRMVQRLQKTVNSVQRSSVAIRDDLSIGTGSLPSAGATALLITVKVLPGKQGEFEGLIKNEILPAMKKIGVERWVVHQTGFGGDPNEWLVLSSIPNMAALDQAPPLVRALGQEGAAQVMAKMSPIISDVQYSITRLVGDLSHLPEAAAGN